MKTDDEMIESLFRRREEYYRKAAKKNTVFAALKVIGGVALPIAAAGAVTLFMISAQKNVIKDDIGTDITEIPKSDAAAASDIYDGEKSYDPSENWEESSKMSFENPPTCLSFEGTIYMYDNETYGPEMYQFLKYRLSESGTAVTLEADSETERCTVYDLEGTDKKAVFTDGGICLYKAVGSSSYTVEGIEFEIKALHRTAKNCLASTLPVFREGEDIIFRAYDESGNPVNDTFILYTPLLTEVADNALWEVSSKYSYDPTYSAPINLCSYDNMIVICRMIQSDGLNAEGLINIFGSNAEIVINDELIAVGFQAYYTDLHRTEYVLEAYDNSDKIALTRIATGERIYITEPECDYKKFLSPESVPDGFRDEYEDTADKVSRLFEMYAGDTLTVKELNEVGFEVSKDYMDRYEIFYTEHGKKRAAAVFMDDKGDVEGFIALDIEEYYERYCGSFDFILAGE